MSEGAAKAVGLRAGGAAAGRGARDRAGFPERVTLEALIGLKAAGESIDLGAVRVRSLASGGHLSAFKGRGVEFDESRPYQPGDDLRTMDWRVTARTGKPHTKVFREERNRPVMVWLDLRSSMRFGTRGAFKAVRAAEAAALIAWSAVGNGDRFGALVFSETEHHEQRPRLGRRAALQLLQLVSSEVFWTPNAPDAAAAGRENADHALLRLTRVVRPGALIFLLSDFRGLGPDAERHIRQLARHGEVFLVHVFDPVEAELPPPGRYRIKVGNRSFAIDTADAALRAGYRARFDARRASLAALARVPGVHLVDCATTGDPRVELTRRFKNR
ncbi:MAG TPA: DUF58 domain-containing protein [Gammaproteobacteria bacterium]|nr:DUF58 domain-containing protein [Gammaproteobacteria bacterium]